MRSNTQDTMIVKAMRHRVSCIVLAVLGVAMVGCSAPDLGSPTTSQVPIAPGPVQNQATVYSHQIAFSRVSDSMHDAALLNPTAIFNAMKKTADSLNHAADAQPDAIKKVMKNTADSLSKAADAYMHTAQQVADSIKKDQEHWEQCTLADSLVLKLTPNGGQMSDHGNSIVFPKGAVSQNVTITMYPILGRTIAVRFAPEGLIFNPTAKPLLTLNTDCIGNPPFAHIVYEDDNGNRILDWLMTVFKDQHSVSVYLEHFSRYAVAW